MYVTKNHLNLSLKKKKQKKFEIVEYILKQNLYGLNLKSYLKHCSNS